MKLVIGIIGEKGSGKGLFTELLRKVASESVNCIKSSDILRDTLLLWDLPITRSNLQQLAIIMNEKYGDNTLSHAVEKIILDDAAAEIVIYDGIRWPSDVATVRDFLTNTLLYITAPAEVRYRRTVARNEKAGEGTATFEQFLAEEQVQTETQIIELATQADTRIENTGTREELEEKVWEFYKNLVQK